MNIWDLVITGSGPAGLTAALYAARAGLKTLVFEKDTFGGYIVNADLVENFPCFPDGISGSKLMANLQSQVMKYGVEFKLSPVIGIELVQDELKGVKTPQGIISAKTVIIAGGAKPKKLGISGEDEFEGNGISYCAYCDGGNFKEKHVAIIGGGDAGISEGLYMTRIGSKITIIEILSKSSAAFVLQQRAKTEPKIEIFFSTMVEEITAEGDMRIHKLKNVESGKSWNLKVSGIFIHVGLDPQTDYLKGVVELDDLGFVLVNQNMETSVRGIFAAGDIRSGSARQAITAAGDGATAAISAEKFITVESKNKRDWHKAGSITSLPF